MSISISTNVNSIMAQENLRVNNEFQTRTIQRLTSGYRINWSGDDAAGLAVANKFRSDIAELHQGVRNANDGISQLQIIDGGANNISKILDRMKTLATQASSTTFTGNRATLDTEFQALKTEIDRQAANIGLNNGGTFNTTMDVYIGGGGTNQSNAKVSVDLSGSANRVDSTALGVGGTSLLSGGTQIGTDVINTAGFVALNNVAGLQTFTFQLNSNSVIATVTGGTGGITTDNAVSQLNAALNSSGISAFVNSTTGVLNFASSSAYTLLVGAVGGGGNAVATAAAVSENTAMYRQDGTNAAYVNVTLLANAETLAFTKNGVTTSVVLDNTTGATIGAALSTLNTALAATGIVALRDKTGANGITFEASETFSVASTHAAGVQGVYAADQAITAATAPVAGSSATANALSSLNNLVSAVSNLGSVQGKIGTGQNKLSYAINLAQAQISSFSAAESRIRDADVAEEAANLTKAQVMQQASLAAMAQANSAPQAVLALLRG